MTTFFTGIAFKDENKDSDCIQDFFRSQPFKFIDKGYTIIYYSHTELNSVIFQSIKKWRQRWIIQHSKITEQEWQLAFAALPLLSRLNPEEKTALKNLAILFLHYKYLQGIGDLEITTSMRLSIALQACLPILKLGLDWYKGWYSVVIYPGGFSKNNTVIDEYGVEHQSKNYLSGESWQQGPVVLSWNDIAHPDEAHNVVIHEFAHKLDMLNGRANGFPPLHKGMSAKQWSLIFNNAYADFQTHLLQHDALPIDPYAATSPAEFFAVFSEIFFEKPEILQEFYPQIYTLLVDFYLQDPAKNSGSS